MLKRPLNHRRRIKRAATRVLGLGMPLLMLYSCGGSDTDPSIALKEKNIDARQAQAGQERADNKAVDNQAPLAQPYQKIPVVLSRLPVAVTEDTAGIADDLADAVQQRQTGLTVELFSIAPSLTDVWWRQREGSHAALLTAPMTAEEKAAFEQDRGYAPTEMPLTESPETLFLYLDHDPASEMTPAEKALLSFAVSREGRNILADQGYQTTPLQTVSARLQQLGMR